MADDGVVKVIELVGSSGSSFSDAVRNAVRTASRTIRRIQGVEVVATTADVDETGELSRYKATCRIAFLVETPEQEDLAAMAADALAEPPVEPGGPDLEQ